MKFLCLGYIEENKWSTLSKGEQEEMSKHPGVRLGGPFEIRPIDEELTERANARGILAGAR